MSHRTDVKAFHEKHGIAYDGPPRFLPGKPLPANALAQLEAAIALIQLAGRTDVHAFRLGFLLEEVLEYAHAHAAGDLDQTLDALVDLEYVLHGTAHLHGFDGRVRLPDGRLVVVYDEAWRRVQAANLEKVRPASTGRTETGLDLTKPDGWVAPTFRDLIHAPRVADNVDDPTYAPGAVEVE